MRINSEQILNPLVDMENETVTYDNCLLNGIIRIETNCNMVDCNIRMAKIIVNPKASFTCCGCDFRDTQIVGDISLANCSLKTTTIRKI